MWIGLGMALPVIATFCADCIVQRTPAKLADPQMMLGLFLKNQVLKLAIFIIISLGTMQIAQNHSHFIFIGMLISIVTTKFTMKEQNHERTAYSN